MATIANQTLTIDNVDDTTVLVTVNYELTRGPTEKTAAAVFNEDMRLMGDDNGTLTELFAFASGPKHAQFALNSTTGTVLRSRSHNLAKSVLNEHPAFLPDGSENLDEIKAKITLSYAANAPIPPNLPLTVFTDNHIGAYV